MIRRNAQIGSYRVRLFFFFFSKKCLFILIVICYKEKMHFLVLKQITYCLRKIEQFCKKYMQLITLRFRNNFATKK